MSSQLLALIWVPISLNVSDTFFDYLKGVGEEMLNMYSKQILEAHIIFRNVLTVKFIAKLANYIKERMQ